MMKTKMKKVLVLALGTMAAVSMPLTAMASTGSVKVEGSIELNDPSVGFDVTIPTSVEWYVNDSSRPVVVNGKNGVADADVWGVGTAGVDYTVNTITNNSKANIDVTLNNFTLADQVAT